MGANLICIHACVVCLVGSRSLVRGCLLRQRGGFRRVHRVVRALPARTSMRLSAPPMLAALAALALALPAAPTLATWPATEPTARLAGTSAIWSFRDGCAPPHATHISCAISPRQQVIVPLTLLRGTAQPLHTKIDPTLCSNINAEQLSQSATPTANATQHVNPRTAKACQTRFVTEMRGRRRAAAAYVLRMSCRAQDIMPLMSSMS